MCHPTTRGRDWHPEEGRMKKEKTEREGRKSKRDKEITCEHMVLTAYERYNYYLQTVEHIVEAKSSWQSFLFICSCVLLVGVLLLPAADWAVASKAQINNSSTAEEDIWGSSEGGFSLQFPNICLRLVSSLTDFALSFSQKNFSNRILPYNYKVSMNKRVKDSPLCLQPMELTCSFGTLMYLWFT